MYIYIESHLIYMQYHLTLLSLFFLYSVSHIAREDILSQTLSCSRFTNNQIELRKRQVQKYRKQNIE